MKTAAAEDRELLVERKNRWLGAILLAFALVLMTVSFALMKIFHFVPTPPK